MHYRAVCPGLLSAVAAIILSACGGNSQPAIVTAQPSAAHFTSPAAPAQASAPFVLAAPGALLAQHGASFTPAEGYSDGADFDAGLPNNRVSPAGTTAGFIPGFNPGDSGLANAAYCVYSFTLPDYNNDAPVDIQLTFSDAPAAGRCFVGLSDFDGGFWTWFTLPGDGRLLFPGFTEYISPSDIHLLCVAVTGSDAVILDSIQISTEQPPLASLVPDLDSGIAPLNVNFDGSGSTDPDGTIVNYEWDLDGDGLFNETGAEQAAAGLDSAEEVYTLPGSYDVTLRVTDDADLQDEATVQINVSASQPPVADLQADDLDGDKPLSVNFNATGSMDPDGTVTGYEWDFDGDNNFGEADNGEDLAANDPTPPTVIYTAVGNYNATVRVMDNEGGLDTASVLITVTNAPPTAVIQAVPTEGDAPLQVSFTAEASSDTGGMIVDYEWDFDGDGLFNEAGTQEETARGVISPSDIDYTEPGIFNATLRVTDDDDASDTASLGINVHGWQVIVADEPEGSPNVNHCNLVLIDGNPAIAYTILGSGVRYGRSSTLLGSAPADWTFIDVPGNLGEEISLAQTASGPGIAGYLGGSSFDLIYQVAAGDGTQAADWSSVVPVDTTGTTGRFPELRIVSGNPAITYWNGTDNKLLHARSLDNNGDLIIDWLPATVIHDAAADENILFLETYEVLGMNPAVVYYYWDNPADHLRFRRSSDALGDNSSDWTSFFDFENSDGSGAWQSYGLRTLSGNPAIIYRSDPDGSLFFRTAQDAAGSGWNARVTIASAAEVGNHGSFNLIGGFPAYAYQTSGFGDLKYVRSETAGGGAAADWDTVEIVDSANFVGGFVKLIEVDGKPAVCYVDSTILGVKYAIRY